MTEQDLQAIEQRNAERTSGIWTWEDDPPTLYSGRTNEWHGLNLLGRLRPDTNGPANLDFITACSVDIPALLAEVRRLQALEKDRDTVRAENLRLRRKMLKIEDALRKTGMILNIPDIS